MNMCFDCGMHYVVLFFRYIPFLMNKRRKLACLVFLIYDVALVNGLPTVVT